MKITVIGCGSAFSHLNYNQSFLLEEDGRTLLIDCGTRIPIALHHHNIPIPSIDDMYISHQHADHCGGIEEIAFSSYDWISRPEHYSQWKNDPINLYGNADLLQNLWNESLKGGLKSMEGFTATLDTFFHTRPIKGNEFFKWQGWTCELIQQIHIMTGSIFSNTYGLFMSKEGHKSVYFTTDSQHCSPKQIEIFYKRADIIFQDCECVGVDIPNRELKFSSGVHASYAQLAGWDNANAIKLSPEIKAKMWLSHYQDFVSMGEDYLGNKCDWDKAAEEDGFAGFLNILDTFEV